MARPDPRTSSRLKFEGTYPSDIRIIVSILILALGAVLVYNGYSLGWFCAIPGIASNLVRWDLFLDPAACTFEMLQGMWPWLRRSQGSFDELRCIKIEQNIQSSRYGAEIWCTVSLKWVVPTRRDYPLKKFGSLDAAASFAAKLHEVTGIPLEEGDNLVRLRNVLENPAYRQALSPHP